MMFGNYLGDSISGVISTRDTITGEKTVQGRFVKNAVDIYRDATSNANS